jgi:hypothetical protein
MARLFELGHSYRRSYPTEESYTVPFAQRRKRRRMTWGVSFMDVGDWCSEYFLFCAGRSMEWNSPTSVRFRECFRRYEDDDDGQKLHHLVFMVIFYQVLDPMV